MRYIFLAPEDGKFVLDPNVNPAHKDCILYGRFEFTYKKDTYMIYLSTLMRILSPQELRALKNKIEASSAYKELEHR